MATTREQAEAYAYENRRRTTGLLRGADEAQDDPRRRLNRSLGAGVAFGILAMAGFGIAGFLMGGRGDDLPQDGAVVVGDDGDRYVVNDGTVHPALNLASALLIGGGEVGDVKQDTLNEAGRGLPVGIPGAPDALPGEDDLVDDPWTLCTVPSETGGPPAATALYVSVGGIAPGGDTSGSTVLAEQEDGELWLLTDGRRYALTENLRDILELRSTEPVELPEDVIATLPEGPELDTPDPGDGTGDTPDAALPVDAVVNDLAHTEGGSTEQYYLVRPDGLVTVSELLYTLLLPTAEQDHALSAADAAQAPRSDESPPGDRAWPQEQPRADVPSRDQPVCVSTPPGGEPGDAPWQATVHLPDTMPSPSGVEPVVPASGERLGLLDEVYLPSGAGAVVRATTSAAAGGTHTLVTDAGMTYPFASPDAVERLRYDPTEAPTVPKTFVGLLPAGPVLDPEAAARQHRGGGEMEELERSEETAEQAQGAGNGDGS